MPRTSDAAVRLIIKTKAADDLTPFIETANSLVTGVCVDDDDITYGDTLLELIERWLAAHFYAIMRPRSKFQSAGKVQQSFESKVDLYLNETRYGTTAITNDIYGKLAAFNNDLAKVRGQLSIYQQSITYLGGYQDDLDLEEEDDV